MYYAKRLQNGAFGMIYKKAVAVMITNDSGEILILRRGHKSRYEPGAWELCGGAVEEGETFQQAIEREVNEELGCAIAVEKELIHDTYADMGDGVAWEIVVFQAKKVSEPVIQETEKCEELKWVSNEVLLGMHDQLATHLQEDLKKLGWKN